MVTDEAELFDSAIERIRSEEFQSVYIYGPVGLWQQSDAKKQWFAALANAVQHTPPTVREVRALFGLPPTVNTFDHVAMEEIKPFENTSAQIRYLPPPTNPITMLPGVGLVILDNKLVGLGFATRGNTIVVNSTIFISNKDVIDDIRSWFGLMWENARDFKLQDVASGVHLATGITKARSLYFTHHATEVQSIRNPSALHKSVELIKAGEPLGLFNRGVCAIWGNGADPNFVEKVYHIKGEQRGNRPLATTLRSQELIQLVDKSKISKNLHRIFLNPDELTARLGSLCFIRIPITESAAAQLPSCVISRLPDNTPIIQNWDPSGHEPARILVNRMEASGIWCPAITSMNISGKPEIVSQSDGLDFALEAHIPMFLLDFEDKHIVLGSYTILAVDEKGVKVVREGNISSRILEQILQLPFDRANTIPSKFPQNQFASFSPDGLSPSEMRMAILSAI